MVNTNPAYWFLDEADTLRTPAFTTGNDVRALIDGAAYMDDLAEKLRGTAHGDYFHFAGWRLSPGQRLRPGMRGSPTFLDQLRTLVASGVDVRVALWYVRGSAFSRIGWAPTQAQENIDAVRGVIAAGGQAILDSRLARSYHSHHQKACVLSSGGVDYAYVGGIDICLDRWDTCDHANSPNRSIEKFEAWHDVHTVIRGPAVAHVWQNFAERWNDPSRPHSARIPGGAVPTPISSMPPQAPSASTHNVQVLRTLACGIYPFAPDGEQTVRLAYERAIERAEHYIYIEDQFLWPCSVVDRLRDAAARGVKIVFVTSHHYGGSGPGRAVHNYMRRELLDCVRSGNSANVFAYHLQRLGGGADIYVHSKLMIVDDCYATIGSANIGLRSFTSDSELQIAVVDDSRLASTMGGRPVVVSRLALELRVALWKEHLGLVSESSVWDPILALNEWPRTASSNTALPTQKHHAVTHNVPAPQRRGTGVLASLMNAETNCGSRG